MATLYDLARLAQFAYNIDDSAPSGWTLLNSTNGRYGFRAAAYIGNGETVVAFRGTNLTTADLSASAGDVAADVMLGVGMNTSHFGQAEDFVADIQARGALSLAGHSLGGAMAQIVGNRMRLPFATFNAPGVAVLASRNITEASALATALRLGGALFSAVLHPVQAARDISAAFYRVRGVNVRLDNDVVSMIGVHYGKVVSVPGTSRMPQHSIDTVVSILATNGVGNTAIRDYCTNT